MFLMTKSKHRSYAKLVKAECRNKHFLFLFMLTEVTKMQYKIHYQVWGKKPLRVPSGRPQENGDMPKMSKPEPI